jgi:hypothetical protein
MGSSTLSHTNWPTDVEAQRKPVRDYSDRRSGQVGIPKNGSSGPIGVKGGFGAREREEARLGVASTRSYSA